MASFMRVLGYDHLPSDFRFRFAILGLGDSTYRKYNWCAKTLQSRLESLGAQPVISILADNNGPDGFYTGFYKFAKSLAQYLLHSTGNDSRLSKEDVLLVSRRHRARILSNKQLTPDGYEHPVREIIFSIPDYKSFYPGDCLKITPTNSRMDIPGLSSEEAGYIFRNIDLQKPPHWTIFCILPDHTENQLFKEKLIEISRNYNLYYDYIVVPRRSIIEVLSDFQIPPVFSVLSKMPKIEPRHYSCTKEKSNYKILVNIRRYDTILPTPRTGLCSSYLESLAEDIDVGVSPSLLSFSSDNLLFFATGTGITLPRSVIKFYPKKKIRIYYGFRHYMKDRLCWDELLGRDRKSTRLNSSHMAISRMPSSA
jgi:sulfite reductase alpha subunit-like flavoprotein